MRSIDEILRTVPDPASEHRKISPEQPQRKPRLCPTCKNKRFVERGPVTEGDCSEFIPCPECSEDRAE